MSLAGGGEIGGTFKSCKGAGISWGEVLFFMLS